MKCGVEGRVGVPRTTDVPSDGMKLVVLSVNTNRTWEKNYAVTIVTN